MHNRDLVWRTADGRDLKLREMTSRHLVNVLNHIDKNLSAFINKFGTRKVETYKSTIRQEIRYRKLEQIRMNNEEQNLF